MLKKHTEGRNVTWVVDLNRQIDEYPLYMDATRIIEDAIRQDVRRGYEPEYGPRFAIEHQRVTEYVNYVTDKLNRDNYYKFDTRFYRFFQGSVPVRKPHSTVGV